MKKIALLIASALILSGCASAENTTVRLAAHDSFVISDELIAEFQSESGFELEIIRLGDTGSLTNQLVLTKNAPVADAFFGIDNTFQSVALENEVVDGEMSAIDFSDVCFNYDLDWFADSEITPPTSWRELGQEQYRGLTVVTNPRFSSPGLAFLATTQAGFATSAEVFAYWRSIRDNDLKVSGSWEDAYFVDFTRYGGDRPIVLSYASSPAAEVNEDGSAGSKALTSECFRQTEYAGVLENAQNKAGAEAIVEFLLADNFQASVPSAMYVYPANTEIEVPADWAMFATPATSVIGVDLNFSENRERWLKDWSDVFDN
ncbi:MAG: thiamine ABC transporter substrate-binding protein [Aquiluna sp.]|nr:thiamine ABC transporter substrate-binding protein [Aquiluna sp.]